MRADDAKSRDSPSDYRVMQVAGMGCQSESNTSLPPSKAIEISCSFYYQKGSDIHEESSRDFGSKIWNPKPSGETLCSVLFRLFFVDRKQPHGMR